MIRLDAATVLLQWAVGGLGFLWVTTRHRMVGLGYGWLMRGIFAAVAVGAVVAARFTGRVVVRDVGAVLVALAAVMALVVSVLRRGAGVSGGDAARAARRARVAAMSGAGSSTNRDGVFEGPGVGDSGDGDEPRTASLTMRDEFGRVAVDDAPRSVSGGPEFAPWLDLVAPAIGVVGLVAGGWDAGGNHVLAIARTLVGAAFLGAVTDAMLLGHWYLVQPGLSRSPIGELNDWLLRLWPVEVALLLVPTGMVSAIRGTVDDGWSGNLTWFWVACAVTTGILGAVTRVVLRERFYSAVMAATGMLYLAILTAFGTDLVARAILG